jgi:cyclopropane-fatty-acyl-phospholipid synthase
VSNSHGQREWIQAQAAQRGFDNLMVLTRDVNDFEPNGRFDRVMSIEMFEHMRNWRELLRRISTWLEPDGKAFVHVFARCPTSSWVPGRPSDSSPPVSCPATTCCRASGAPDRRRPLGRERHHYAKTLQAWLARLDDHAVEALALLREGRSDGEARTLLGTWRLFLISTDVVWRYRGGRRWLVSHYLLEPRSG